MPTVAARVAALPELQPGRRLRARRRAALRRRTSASAAATTPTPRAAPRRWLLVLNQDCVLEPGALERAARRRGSATTARVAAWEMRQIPYEHPKAYDPVTLETAVGERRGDRSSGARPSTRSAASTRASSCTARTWTSRGACARRAGGCATCRAPRVVHRTYAAPREVKPLQVFGGVFGNLACARASAACARTLQGLAMLCAEILAPNSFPGRRWGIAEAGLALPRARAALPLHARASRRELPARLRRLGLRDAARRRVPRVPLARASGRARARPLVSILIRTVDRPAWLREALASCANQTYPNLEVVVVEDGARHLARAVVDGVRATASTSTTSATRRARRTRARRQPRARRPRAASG